MPLIPLVYEYPPGLSEIKINYDSAADAVCRKVLEDCLTSLCVIPSYFVFIFYYLQFVLFFILPKCHTLDWTVFVVMSVNNYLPLGNHTLLTGKKLYIRVWTMITFFGKYVLHTHVSWRWRNFSVQSGDDSHVDSQIHHCRDQLCSRHQGSDNSRHPMCLVQVFTQGQACSMSQASEFHGWGMKIAVLGLDAHGMNPGLIWAWSARFGRAWTLYLLTLLGHNLVSVSSFTVCWTWAALCAAEFHAAFCVMCSAVADFGWPWHRCLMLLVSGVWAHACMSVFRVSCLICDRYSNRWNLWHIFLQ